MNTISAGGLRITGNLNEGIGDATPGSSKLGKFSIVDGALGQLGACVYIDDNEITQYTNTGGTITALYGGWYRYVQMLSTATAALVAGQLCFWSDPTPGKKIVTTDITAATCGLIAGVILSAAWVKGNYWWIFMGGGLVYVKCKAAVTDTTAGDAAYVTQTPLPTVDGFADATAAATALTQKTYLGNFYDAPANGALKRIFMNQLPFNV